MKKIISLALFFVALNVNATMYEFEGMFTQVDDRLSGSFTEGEKFFGSYNFDPTVETSSAPPVYFYSGAISNLHVDSASYNLSGVGGNVILDLEDEPYFEVNSIGSDLKGDDVNGNALDRVSITWTPFEFDLSGLPLFSVEDAFFVLDFEGDLGRSFVSGDLTNVQVAHTPIPGAALLLGSGLIGLIGFSRRKQA